MAIDYSFEDLEQHIERLKTKMRIGVVYGGDKNKAGSAIYVTQNTRPWKSYQKVAHDISDTLRTLGFEHVCVIADDMNLIQNLREQQIDLVWLNTGGMQGYNPVAHTPSLLEMLGLPYVGHNPLTTTLLDNKHCFKRELQDLGLPTSPFMVWDNSKGTLDPEINYRFRRAFGIYRGPFVAKPITGRASLHVYIVEDVDELAGVVDKIYEATHNLVLIERFLGGREFCVTVCGRVVAHGNKLAKKAEPLVFSEIERLYDKGERMFVSMDKKPITQKRARLLQPDNDRDKAIFKQLHTIAKNIYLDFDLTTIVRIDVRADEYGNLFVLEANPKPDLKRFDHGVISLVAMGLTNQDMSYEDLILSLISETLDRLLESRQNNISHVIRYLE